MNNKKVMLFKEAAVKSFQLLLALVKKKVELISINSREKKVKTNCGLSVALRFDTSLDRACEIQS